MILCLDVGNSQVFGGVFDQDSLKLQFRRTTQIGASSDELGLFLKGVLRENEIDPNSIRQISLCSVVPSVVYSLRNACKKYFDINPFILQPGVKTGLKIKYRNPVEVGADRIANAIAGVQMFPSQDLIIIDLGTATTFCAINSEKDYLGGVIAAGLKISMEALESKTAKLPPVEIVAPGVILGRSTVESIQSGLYHGHIGLIKEVVAKLNDEAFAGRKAKIIGTGGFSVLFERAAIFDHIVPQLVLEGLRTALQVNA